MTRQLPLILVISACLWAATARSEDYAIAFSPHQASETARAQAIAALRFATELSPGDSVRFFDGYTARLIATFAIPERQGYSSAKARLAVNGQAVQALMQFADTVQWPANDKAPSHVGALRLPQLLRSIAEYRFGSEPWDVVLPGSSLYDDPEEPAFAMTEGRYPSDGHLTHTRRETVFGVADYPTLLNNLRVHIAYVSSTLFAGDRHLYHVERFLTLFLEAQGGEMVTFVPEWSTVIERVTRKVPAPPHNFEHNGSDKLEMIRLREADIQQSIYERALSTEPLASEQIIRAEQVVVGLSWDCANCDLDVYARATPDAAPIYFGNTKTAQGTLWKDHLTSPRQSNGFETIAFHAPLDLRALRLVVNFYSGDAPTGVYGELRLAIGETTYSEAFHIAASNGNAGAGILASLMQNSAATAHTQVFDPIQMVTAP